MFFMTINNKNDRTKVERLYYNYRKLMYKEAYEILHDHTLCEDAVSESFIRIINNLHKIDENNCPRTRSFLVIICRNVAKDIYKSRLFFNLDDETVDNIPEESCSNPEEVIISKESIARITNAIEQLAPIYRDVFLLRRVHELSREEIAKIFNISVETVKKRLTRAKSKIMEKLKKEEISNE